MLIKKILNNFILFIVKFLSVFHHKRVDWMYIYIHKKKFFLSLLTCKQLDGRMCLYENHHKKAASYFDRTGTSNRTFPSSLQRDREISEQ